jgi:hypothetical protein
MRPFAAVLALATLAGCPPKAPPEAPTAQQPVYADIACPPGTLVAGQAPPLGQEVWCQRPNPDGTFTKVGPSITWHSNGRKASEGAFREGKKDGPWLFWYPTGTPERQGTYAFGVPEGVWTSYHPNGERASEGQMVDGEEHARWTYWNAETLTRVEGEYVLGERDGTWMDFGPDDRPIRERTYRSGRLVSQREL